MWFPVCLVFNLPTPSGYLEPCRYQGWLKPTSIQHTHSHTCTEIRQIIMVNSSVDSHDSHDYNVRYLLCNCMVYTILKGVVQ